MNRPLFAFLAILSACGGVDEENDTGLPDALNDEDAGTPIADSDDGDSDSDEGSDADEGAPPYADWNMVGQVNYVSTSNDVIDCDAQIALAGSSFVGTCEGCDYAFLVDAAVTDDHGSTEECAFNPLLSFIGNGVRENLVLAHSPEAYIEQDDVDVLVQDLVQVGFSLYYEATDTSEAIELTGPFWWQMYYEDIAKESTFSRDGDEINWSFRFENTVATWDGFAMLDDCGMDLADEATESIVAEVSREETIPCDGWQADVWEVVLGPEDDQFEVQIDTLADDTTFDPAMLVNDPEGCVSLYADDGFDCSHPPPTYQCPAGTVDGGPGIYQIIVFSYGQCTAEDVEYRIEVSGSDAASTLHLVMDNVDRFENLQFTTKVIDVAGCATLYPDGTPIDTDTCQPLIGSDGEDMDGEDTATSSSDTGEPGDTGELGETGEPGEPGDTSDVDIIEPEEDTGTSTSGDHDTGTSPPDEIEDDSTEPDEGTGD